jgi:hypothetical protein
MHLHLERMCHTWNARNPRAHSAGLACSILNGGMETPPGFCVPFKFAWTCPALPPGCLAASVDDCLVVARALVEF